MLAIIIGLLIGTICIVVLEQLYKKNRLSNEAVRKILHVISGLVLITWSFYISWESIVIVETVFFFVAALVRWTRLLSSQISINRISWGEFFFPVGVILTIALGAPRWVFILAVLHLALADSAAALIGQRYGKSNSYSVLGQTKSLTGSLAFFVVSASLVAATFMFGPVSAVTSHQTVLWLLPFIASLAENVGIFGTDNLLIPMAVVWLLI